MKLKVVYFTFVGIGTPSNGGAICCRNHIKRLSEDDGIELFVVIAGEQSQKQDSISYLTSLGIRGKFVAFLNVGPRIPVSYVQREAPIPAEMVAYGEPHVDLSLLEALKMRDADILLIEYLYSALFCPKSIKAASKCVLITLNRETALHRDLLKRTSYTRLEKAKRLTRMWFFEQAIFRSMHKIIALSPTDVSVYKGSYITPYLDVKAEKWIPNASRHIFFVGGVVHYPNVEAIEYIITKLAPAVTALLPDVRFKIIGASLDDVPFRHLSVDLLGKVDAAEVERQFLNCQLFICPIKNTQGLKFKMAEALSYGTPFLASPETMLCLPYLKGLPTMSFYDPEQAARSIAAVIRDQASTIELAEKITLQHQAFIATQKNIWSRSLV